MRKKISVSFENLNFHDCAIYQIGFSDKHYTLDFDIDYILEWIIPDKKGGRFAFKVAPGLLQFKNVWSLSIDIEGLDLSIDSIERRYCGRPKNADFIKFKEEYEWVINLRQGVISFRSVGFELFLKSEPIIQLRQKINESKRKKMLQKG